MITIQSSPEHWARRARLGVSPPSQPVAIPELVAKILRETPEYLAFMAERARKEQEDAESEERARLQREIEKLRKDEEAARETLNRALDGVEVFRAHASRMQMVRFCAKAGCVSIEDILSAGRSASIIRVRHVIYWILRRYTTHSLPEIGRGLRGRDHTTILHGVRRVQRWIDHSGFEVSDSWEHTARGLIERFPRAWSSKQ